MKAWHLMCRYQHEVMGHSNPLQFVQQAQYSEPNNTVGRLELMQRCALREIPWIPIKGPGMRAPEYITVEDALTRGTALNDKPTLETSWVLTGAGFEAGTVFRFLASIVAVAERYRDETIPRPKIDAQAIEKTLDTLAPYCDPYSKERPFMQRKELPGERLEDIPDKDNRVKNLSTAVPSSGNLVFWQYRRFPETLSPSQAALTLVAYHYYSAVGNAKYDDIKLLSGAPAIHSPSAGLACTEIIACTDSLYETLLINIPSSWVTEGGLPAWADRYTEHSDPDAALWKQTWSSNTAVCNWDNNGYMIRAKGCGIPREWLTAAQGSDDDSIKRWYPYRNLDDPFYLFMEKKQKDKKSFPFAPVRLALGADATELAVNWIANGHAASLNARLSSPERLLRRRPKYFAFLRHLVAGSSTTLVTRGSDILVDKPDLWAPDKASLIKLKGYASIFVQLQNSLRRSVSTNLPGLPNLSSRASTAFWRESSILFERLTSQSPTLQLEQSIFKDVLRATTTAYSVVTKPYEGQHLATIELARKQLFIDCKKILQPVLSEE